VNIFISGSDYNNYTMEIIKLLNNKFIDITFDVIIGGSNSNYKNIKTYCEKFDNLNFYYNIDNIPEVLSKADLCIGSIGQSFYERLLLKIPSIVFTIADNQLEIYDKYKNNNIFIYCGHKIPNCEIIINKLTNIIDNVDQWKKMVSNCINLSNKFISKNYIKDIINKIS
jgi:UDP-2,4-diacetamido-2,4,6-trideoxy-beta-L-altropyranose hydrolase